MKPTAVPGTTNVTIYYITYPRHIRYLLAFAKWLTRWCERRQVTTKLPVTDGTIDFDPEVYRRGLKPTKFSINGHWDDNNNGPVQP